MTSDLYQAKTPYVGMHRLLVICQIYWALEVSLAVIICLWRRQGQPYDCRYIIKYPMKGEKKEKALEQMKKDACVMLALVDNLDSVSWEYMMTAEDNNGVENIEDDSRGSICYVGKDIKTCGESPKALQEMLTQLDFNHR